MFGVKQVAQTNTSIKLNALSCDITHASLTAEENHNWTISEQQHYRIFTLFFLLVGAGGLISFCRILRHMRVMFSTTTGVFIFTDMRNRLRATWTKNIVLLDLCLTCKQSQLSLTYINLLSNINKIIADCNQCSINNGEARQSVPVQI